MSSPSLPPDRARPTLTGVLAAAGGVALFVYFIRRAGVADVAEGISRLGWMFLIVIGLGGIRFLARAAAWTRCLDGRHRLRLRDAFAAIIVGDALGNMTPLSLIVSEPAKALFVRGREPVRRTLPALAVENLFYTLSVMLVIAGGLVAAILLLQTPSQLGFITGAVIVTMVAIVVTAHWIIWNRLPLASGSLTWLGRHGITPTTAARAAARCRNAEQHIFALYPRDSARLVPVALLEVSFHVVAVLEVFLVLWVISDFRPTLLDALILESTNRFIAVAFKFVPLRIGVDEAGSGLFAELLGFGTAAGVGLAIVRKGRMLVWMAVGVAVMAARGLSPRTILSSAAPPVAVVVMARSPFTGASPKTRLAERVADEGDRRRLYAAFLEDTLTACRAIGTLVMKVAYTPDGGVDGLSMLGVRDEELIAQRGADLGARERHVFEDLFADGFQKVVIVGSDLPTLPMHFVGQAVDETQPGRVVLGPSSDGGYYLIALGAPPPGQSIPDVFSDIRWSTSSALDDTREAARRAGLTVVQVPEWYDVDDAEGLERLQRELDTDAGRTRAPRTAEALQAILPSSS